MKNSIYLLIMGLLLCGLSSPSKADTVITDPGSGQLDQAAPQSTLGFDFTVGAHPLSVASLGVYDYAQDGLLESHTIGLWATTGTLLASVVVPIGTGASLSRQFRYESLSFPIILNPGQTYVLGASYVGGVNSDVLVGNYPESAAFDNAVLPRHLRADVGNGFAYPELIGGLGSDVGPNAVFSIVPEPNAEILITVAMAFSIPAMLYRSFSRRTALLHG